MKKRKSIEEEVSKFQELNDKAISLEKKLDELISMLEESDLDSNTVSRLQDKLNHAFDSNRLTDTELDEFKKLDNQNVSRLEMADDLEVLLTRYKLDSNDARSYAGTEKWAYISQFIIAVILVALGFAMIIMPAPPYFEMFTIFYFTPDDGVTLMDLISLLIIFTGVYLLFTSITKLNRR